MARRPGQLTEEDRLNLQSQGLPPDCHDELAIIKARYELALGCKIIEVKSGQSLSQEVIVESIANLLNTTQNDGGKDISVLVKRFCPIMQNLWHLLEGTI